MSNPDPNRVTFSSRYRYFLCKDREDGSVSVPSVSIPAAESDAYSISIPIDDMADFSQIKINFSHIPDEWHVFPNTLITLDANCDIQVSATYTTTTLEVYIYVTNQTAGSVNNTAFSVAVRVHPFEPPV